MKKIHFILAVLILCSGCEYFVEFKYVFDVWNDSNKAVYVYAQYMDNSSDIPAEKPQLEEVKPKGYTAYYDREFDDPEFSRLEQGEKIIVIFFDKEVVDNTDWSVIREKKIILKKYVFTEKDLRAHEGVRYP